VQRKGEERGPRILPQKSSNPQRVFRTGHVGTP
jgi:hypothetical protein